MLDGQPDDDRQDAMTLYTAYELNRMAGQPMVVATGLAARTLQALPASVRSRRPVRRLRAACEVVSRAHPTHRRPEFGIATVSGPGGVVPVTEQSSWFSPFATLIHFAKPTTDSVQPRVLVVGPLSGHFTTLIRPTIRTLLQDADVHVLDWHNARDIPIEEGPFGLDNYIEHVMRALRQLGPGTHVVAVCQPAVPVLAAVALLAADEDPALPLSLTLMAGPIDTRINPNRVNEMAAAKPLSYFESRVISRVPSRYPGAGRRVYPGFVQLAAFMSMNRRRHLDAHLGLYRDLVAGNETAATATRSFYDEYGAVMDVPAEFYLETVDRVFKRHLLARGELDWRDRRVDLSRITGTALLTVEGVNDDVCSPGQTKAAHDLCDGIDEAHKKHHLQPGVGHYGVFSGSRWEADIYPVVRDFIAAHQPAVRH